MIEKKDLNEALDLLIKDRGDLSGALKEGGLLKQLTKALMERLLQAELEDHLGYGRYDRVAAADNSRNGVGVKQLITEHGPINLEVPRDRSGSFEPQMVSSYNHIMRSYSNILLKHSM